MVQVLQLKQEKEHLLVVERMCVQRLEAQEAKVERLRAQNTQVIAETSRLRAKLSASYAQLRSYQHQLRVQAASSRLHVQALPAAEVEASEDQEMAAPLALPQQPELHHLEQGHHLDVMEQVQAKQACASDKHDLNSKGTVDDADAETAVVTTASTGTQV